MANNFEYKIHVSIDQDSVKGDVASILKKMKAEIENNAYKVELTGDPKQLIKDLANLKKMIPSLDLSEGLQFHLADILKDNTEEGKKIIDQFATYIINSVNETVSSIDSISEAIKKTQSELNNLYSRKKSLLKDDGTLDVVTAYENAQKKLQEASNKYADSKQKGKKEVYAQEMRDAYQDVLNFETEAQKAGAKVLESTETIRKGFSDIFEGMTANGSYKQAIAEVEKNIYTLENKLTGLKKDLESAQNPELKVKGKLANNFLSDLQSQLDSLTGLEVKVRPVVDKNVKLEVEADIKPKNNTDTVVDEIKEDVNEVNKEAEIAVNKFTNVDTSGQDKIQAELKETTKTAEETSKTLSNIVYHAGDLSNITNSSKTHPLGVVGEGSHFRNTNGLTGLYTTEDLDGFWANEWQGAPISSIDISKYKLFVADTEESATKLGDFFAHMADFISGTSINDVGESIQSDMDIPRLYSEFQKVFGESVLSIEEFENFLKNAKTTFENNDFTFEHLDNVDARDIGAYKQGLENIRRNLTDEIFNSDSFQTQLLKKLGYEGLDVRGTSWGSTYKGGSVLFDIKPESIVNTNEKWSDVMGRNGYKITEQDLQSEQNRAELVKESAKSYFELADSMKKVSEEKKIDSTNLLQQAQQQAESTVESLDKIDQEVNDDITNPGLDSIESDLQDVGDTAEVSTSKVEQLREVANELNMGNVDVTSTTSYGKNDEGEITSNTHYKMTDGNSVAVLDEELNLQREIVTVLDDKSRAEAEAANLAEVNAQVVAELNQQIDAQANKFKALVSEQNKYESSMSKDSVQKYKEQYNELTQKVKEYVDLRKETAKSGKLDSDVADIQRLDNEIIQMADDLEKNPLFNQAFEDKALSGLNNIEAKVQSIRFDKIISNYKELASLQSERYSLTNKGVSEDSKSIQYLDDRIGKINEENTSLLSLSYTTEQLTAIQEAEKNSLQGVNKQRDINVASGKRLEQTIENTRAALQKQAASLTSNGKLMKVYGSQVNALLEEIKNPNTTLERLNEIRNELNKISAEAIVAGQSGKSLFQILKQRAQSLVAYLSTFASFYRIASYIRTAFTTIQDLDTQLVDLRKTTTMTVGELNEFYGASSDVAKQLGVTTSEIISQASAWSRLGYSSKEAATQMAELSSQFTSISPGMTTDNATDYLVSTMQAYGIAVDDVERKIMDNVNRIGNTFATTNAEIGEMLTRSSAAMHAANNTLEETIALESAAVQITRNAETTGTAFRTISMRIRGYDEETEELSSDLENISGDIYDLTKVGGKGISIFTDETRKEYKSTYDILKEIAGIWDELTDKQQADLLEKLGGKRGAQSLAGILEDFSEVDRAMQEMENAAGSADEEMGIIRDSLEFKINALKQTWVGVLQDITDRGELGSWVDRLTSVSEGLGDIISKLGIVKTAIIGIGTVVGSQKLGIFNTKDNSTILGALSQISQGKAEISQYRGFLSAATTLSKVNPDYLLTADFSKYTNLSEGVRNNIISIQQEVNKAGGTAQDAFGKINASLQQSNDKANKAIATFKKFGSTIVNALASAAIMYAISRTVQFIQDLTNSSEDLAKRASEVASEFNKEKSQIDDYSAKITELKGVMEDSSSTTEEVADATSQLYDIQNDLISTYGAYHEGIDLVNGDLEEQLAILQQINKENAQKAINDINAERSALSSGANVSKNIAQMLGLSSVSPLGFNAVEVLFGRKVYDNLKSNKGWGESFSSAFTESDLFGQDMGLGTVGTSVEQITDLYEKFNAEIKATDNSAINDLIDSFDEFTVRNGMIQISGSVDDVSESVIKLQTRLKELGYEDDNLNNQLTNIANKSQEIINNTSQAYETILYDRVQNNDKLLSYYTNIVNLYNDLQKAQDEGDTKKVAQEEEKIKQFFNELYADSDIDEKYVKYFENLYPELQNQLSNWKFEVEILPKIDLTSGFAEQFGVEDYIKNTSLDEILSDYNRLIYEGDAGSGTLNSIFKVLQTEAKNAGTDVLTLINNLKLLPQYSDKYSSLRQLMGDNWKDEYAESFTDEEIALSTELAKEFEGDITFDYDAIKEELSNRLSPITVEVEPEISNTDAVESLDNLEDTFGDLSTAYLASVKNENSNGNVANASDLQGVTDAFGGVTEIKADTTVEEVNALSNAIEEYNSQLLENKGDTKVAQDAADKLATAYVDQSGILDNLTEENKDYYIQQLKANGVTNAAEVVESRLSKQAKLTATNLTLLSKKLAYYSDAINESNKGTEEYEDAMDSIAETTKELLSTYDDTGTAIITPEIDASFIEQNLEDIKAATEGDIDALDRLRLAAARLNASKVYIDVDLPSDVVSAQLDNIMDMVAQADAMDIEVGASIDDSAFLSALSNMMSSSQSTANAVSAAFESMGYSVEWTPNKTTATVAETIMANGGTGNTTADYYTSKGISDVKTTSVTMDVPSLKITRTSSGSSGSKVSYNGSSSGSSSSGGSGGSDSGSDDTSTDEETFDWVEVAINSLEQDLDRLDEAIDDVYDKWDTRNEALANKIQTVTDEIELQQNAAQRYEAEAEKYNDIGADYIQKIKEGILDIETLKVETSDDDDSDTLIEKIQNYQTWWEKAQEAYDKVGTLTRELGELYKDVFDNIESSYEELLDEIEKKTDIIEERITRTEEHGFFVDEAYYKALKTLEEDNFTKLKDERENLINSLNTAVTTGNIEKGSEAWYEMYLAIQDVNKAIEESLTNTVKLNNEIRQLKWDAFDWVEERMDDFAEEADFLIGLLQGEEIYDDRGNFNNRGFANAALIGAKYDDALAEAQRYKDEIAKIDEQLATEEGAYDKNLIEQKEKYVECQRSSIEAAEDEKQAMKSLVEEGIKKHLDWLSKLIDKYKNALSLMKSTYEYSKSIADQTKTVENLTKQLAAYQGDTSEETRKKRQELQNQLNTAQQQLEETQWDKYISQTGEMLDTLYTDYENYLNDKLSSVTVLMNDMIDMINQGSYTVSGAVDISTSSILSQLTGDTATVSGKIDETTISIKDGMKEIKDEYGLTTQKFEKFGETANGTKDILSGWSNGKFTNESTFKDKIDEVKTKYEEVTNGAAETIKKAITKLSEDIVVYDNGTVGTQKTYTEPTTPGTTPSGAPGSSVGDNPNKTDTSGVGSLSNEEITNIAGWYQDSTGYRFRDEYGNDLKGQWFADDKNGGWYYYFDPEGYMLKNQFVEGYWLDDSGHMTPDKFEWHGSDSGGWWFGTSDGGKYIKGESVYIDGNWYTFDENGYWKKYAKGSKSIPYDQMAITQENGSELIYRTNSGALLTPLNQGDMVFTNEMSQRLWDIASGTVPFGFGLDTPNISANAKQDITANQNITIELPNVQNYDDFKREMKQDTELEKFWQEITIGQMMGNAKLKKNRY